MIAYQKNPLLVSSSAATLLLAAALTAFSVSASAAPSANGERAGESKSMHKMGQHKGHHKGHHKGQRKHRGDHGMRSLLKGLDLTDAQRDEIFQIRHASMPAFREQRNEMKAARQALRALAVQGNVDQAALQTQSEALGQVAATMATLRVQSMNQVMNVLTEEQAATVREKMQNRQARGGRGRGDKS